MDAPEGHREATVIYPDFTMLTGSNNGPSSLNKNYLHYDLQWSSVKIFEVDRGDERHSSNTFYLSKPTPLHHRKPTPPTHCRLLFLYS